MADRKTRVPDAARRKLILDTWAERGSALWKVRTAHGSLIVDLPAIMRAPAGRGRPLHLPKSLTFEPRSSTVKGKPVNQVICEGVIVETLK